MENLTAIDHHRIPAPSRRYPRRGLRPVSPRLLTVDPPRDPDYRQFLCEVAAELAKLEYASCRLRSHQPTLCNYWHFSDRFGVCWKCSQVTRPFVTPAITPPNWAGELEEPPAPPPNDASLATRRAYWLRQGSGEQ